MANPHDQTEEELEDELRDHSKLPPSLIYEVIERDGHEELERPVMSLLWSGISAGMIISLSVLGEAILRTYLPDQPYSYLIENLGYSLGFLVVIVGRMQLFTENTITTVLPFLATPSRALFGRIIVLWAVVLVANVIGAFVIASFYAFSGALNPEFLAAFRDLSLHATGMDPAVGFARGIPAGLLVAAIVWMLPEAKNAGVAIIILFTWLIAAGDFTHIVAGSVEMAFLLVTGDLPVQQAVFGFFLPVLAGNVIGGTAIFSMLVYGQTWRDRAAQAKT